MGAMEGRLRFQAIVNRFRCGADHPAPAWPPGWRALLWQTVQRLGIVGLVLALIAAVLPLPSPHSAPRALMERSTRQGPHLLPTRATARAVILKRDPFRADRIFPRVVASTKDPLPYHWRFLPAQSDPRLQVFGIAGPADALQALVGTVRHEVWRSVGARVHGWRLVAIHPYRVLWQRDGTYAIAAIIAGHAPAMPRPQPAALFEGDRR